MLNLIKRALDFCLDIFLDEARQFQLGKHIANRARGDDNYDPETNGEYWALQKTKECLAFKGAVIFDVGAHIGEWTRQALFGLSTDSTIYSFEPSKASFMELKKFSENEAPRVVHPVHAALSDHSGTETMHVTDLYGTNSLHSQYLRERADREIPQHQKLEEVPLLTGDDFCQKHGINHIHFLKIDTEGHEFPILRGFDEMLSSKKIDYLQFEYCHAWIDSRYFLYDVIGLLLKKGYAVAKYRGNQLSFLEDYDKSYEKFEFCNFCAVARPESVASWK